MAPMKLAWATDLHLDFVQPEQFEHFADTVERAAPEHLLISGDLSNARLLESHLLKLAARLTPQIHFVLGNHDYYGSSFSAVENQLPIWCENAGVHYLDRKIWKVDPGTTVIGLNGWADGTAGLASHSTIELNDYRMIAEFRGLSIPDRFDRLRQLGETNSSDLASLIDEAIALESGHLILLTHVPPFVEAAWHEGQHSDPNWAPHFSAPLVGEVLLEKAAASPSHKFEVLCGHTHGSGAYEPLPNLTIHTGRATYGKPQLQDWCDS